MLPFKGIYLNKHGQLDNQGDFDFLSYPLDPSKFWEPRTDGNNQTAPLSNTDTKGGGAKLYRVGGKRLLRIYGKDRE